MILKMSATRFGAQQPRLSRLARGVIAFGNFPAGLIQFGFNVVSEFKPIFKEIVNPRANSLNLRAGQSRQNGFNFLDRTHTLIIRHNAFLTSIKTLNSPSSAAGNG
ncbi:MAG TPA: hypothetical protein VFV81_07905 [Verrucomicrobiae bacterium]|nr:hypothetical protein [Verrucomicrobiae bacterium]